jgi:hypothetical protein
MQFEDRTAAGELRYWPILSRGQIDSRAVAASNCHLIARPVPMTARWGWQRFSPAYDNPDPRKRRSSGIRRKIDSQRQAECKVERNAGCECNGGRIHFPVPHFFLAHGVRFPGDAVERNLGCENGSLKP